MLFSSCNLLREKPQFDYYVNPQGITRQEMEKSASKLVFKESKIIWKKLTITAMMQGCYGRIGKDDLSSHWIEIDMSNCTLLEKLRLVRCFSSVMAKTNLSENTFRIWEYTDERSISQFKPQIDSMQAIFYESILNKLREEFGH